VEKPLVSIITPTFGREAFLPAIAACVRSQSYQNIEWLVLDDSEEPSLALTKHPWEKLRYFHSTKRLSVGAKRNQLLAHASGEIVVHFDDDDYYGPDYITKATEHLSNQDADVALLCGFFVAHLNTNAFGYYRTRIKKGPAFGFNKSGVRPVDLGRINIPLIHLCFGWAYIYRRSVWEQIRFEKLNVFEDREFIRTATTKFKTIAYESTDIDCLHAIHRQSSSQCFPQFLIPGFVVQALSGNAYQHVMWLKSIAAAPNPAVNAEPALSETT
jgi:glycosyltransferase involved in cell wall biosynthesis